MISWPAALDEPLFRKLAWTIIQFVWQGAAVAAALAAIDLLVRPRRAAVRYALSCFALGAMLVWAVATFAGGTFAPRTARAGLAIPAARLVRGAAAEAPVSTGEASSRVANAFASAQPGIAAAWMAGVLLLSLRFLTGWISVERLRRLEVSPVPAAFRVALDRLAERLRVSRPVRLAESAAVAVPMAIGVVKPIILFPVRALSGLSPEEVEAVVAHELAHIRRHDYLVNLAQTFAETLLFYHPAVWWVSRRIRAERENCCDDVAVAATGDARAYARALVELEEMRGLSTEPAMAVTGGALWRRIARLIPAGAPRERASGWVAGLLALGAVWGLGAVARLSDGDPSDTVVVSAHRTTSAARSATPRPARRHRSDSGVSPSAPATPAAPAAPTATAEPADASSPAPAAPATSASAEATAPESPAPDAVVSPAVAASPEESSEPAPAPEAAPAPEPASTPETPQPPARAMEARVLTPDQLLAFRTHGVTPEFVREIAAAGFDRISPENLLALKIHGVTPEYVRAMTGLLGQQTPDSCLALRIHGVTPEFLQSFRDAGYRDVSADEALALRIHGVSPADAKAWTGLGYARLSVDDLLALRIHGVDPAFAAAMGSEGFAHATIDQLLSFRIHGVTPEFVRGFRSLGLLLSADDAMTLRIHGVTPDLAREIQSMGYRSVTTDDLVALRIHGVTPEYIHEQNATSGSLLPLDELIEMRIHRRKGD